MVDVEQCGAAVDMEEYASAGLATVHAREVHGEALKYSGTTTIV